MKVFLSYRRADGLFLAGRLRDRLAVDFGEENVFFDVDSIPPGTDFRDVIHERVAASDVVLALIGTGWDLTRLAGPDDYVRMELGEALRQHKPLIPVLIGETAMPEPSELPEELLPIAYLDALQIRPDPDFRHDSSELVDAITDAKERESSRDAEDGETTTLPAAVTAAPPPDARRRRRWIATSVASAVIAVLVLLVTTIVVLKRGDEAPTNPGAIPIGRLDRWLVEVTEGNGDHNLRTDGGNVIPGTQAAWDVDEQRLAYVPTTSNGCALCGVERGSDRSIELVSASEEGEVHDPAWSSSGSIYYARTKGCVPGPACGDEIVWTRAGAPSSTQLLPSPLLTGVRDLEVDPQTRADTVDETRIVIVDAGGAKLMRNGRIDLLSNGGDVADLAFSADSNYIAGLPEGRSEPQLELWSRQGEAIETVDVRRLLTAAAAGGITTGLDLATVEAISVTATGMPWDHTFVVALIDGANQVGGVELVAPYNADPDAPIHEPVTVNGIASIPYALHKGAALNELIALR
jgi:hypothetical protein